MKIAYLQSLQIATEVEVEIFVTVTVSWQPFNVTDEKVPKGAGKSDRGMRMKPFWSHLKLTGKHWEKIHKTFLLRHGNEANYPCRFNQVTKVLSPRI